jgi:hypothetical protein
MLTKVNFANLDEAKLQRAAEEFAQNYRQSQMTRVEQWNTYLKYPRPIFQKRQADIEREE